MRSGGSSRQIRAEMELRPEEDDTQEQRQKADTLCLTVHVLTKTKLRMVWLQGQVKRGHNVPSLSPSPRLAFGHDSPTIFEPDTSLPPRFRGGQQQGSKPKRAANRTFGLH